jgi:type VI protein secretion system component VasF
MTRERIMKAIDACEPLFQYICRLNRSARKGGQPTLNQVQNELDHLLRDIRAKAKADPELMAELQLGEAQPGAYLALLFFIDFVVANSSLKFAQQWTPLAAEYHELAGEQKFWELLDINLADRSEAATGRVALFYTCIGMGFTGVYEDQPDFLRRKNLECAARLRELINADESAPVCPEAYNADRRMLFRPVRSSLAWITVTLFVLLIGLVVINIVMYRVASSDIRTDLETVRDNLGAPNPEPAAHASAAGASEQNARQ